MTAGTRWRTSAIRVHSVVVEICWRPAPDEAAEVFHEVVDLDDGRVVVLVGHASGGPRAVDVVDQMRGPLRRVLREEPDPAVVLAKLDALPALTSEAAVVACTCALVDPANRAVWVAGAGEPPVVLVDGVGVEAIASPDGALGAAIVRRDVHRTLRDDSAVYLWTSGLLGESRRVEEERLGHLLETTRGLNGASAWASEFARRAAEQFGEPPGEAVVASIRLEPAPAAVPLRLDPPPQPQWVNLQVHIDPADLRTRGLLRILGRLTNLVREVELHVELVDVTSRAEITEAAGVLATPTILRDGPGQPVRVTGWFDSARALGKALQLPMEAPDPEDDQG
ncbi:MAG: SpoIIE family protein phosphatase [Sporichthyaceae bacterium]